jgi:hypothetical protein
MRAHVLAPYLAVVRVPESSWLRLGLGEGGLEGHDRAVNRAGRLDREGLSERKSSLSSGDGDPQSAESSRVGKRNDSALAVSCEEKGQGVLLCYAVQRSSF